MMEENFINDKKSLNSSECYCYNQEKITIQDLLTAKDSRSPSLEEKLKKNRYIYHLINRKTKRGRKEKNAIPKGKIKCEVCLQFSDFSSEDLISCSTCKCLFHFSCYNQCQITETKDVCSYKCTRCVYALEINKPINTFQCFICNNFDGVLIRNPINNIFYHQICFDLLNELKGLEGENICKDNIRKWRYKNSCRYCGEKLSKDKAVIKCKNPKCKEFFHIPCALEKGMIFDLNFMKKYYNVMNNNDIPFFCSNHNKKISSLYKNYVLTSCDNQEDNRKNVNDFINNKKKKTFLNNNRKRNKNKKILNNKKDKKVKRKFITVNNTNNIINKAIIGEDNSDINKNKEIIPIQDNETHLNNNDNMNIFMEKNNNDFFDFGKIRENNNNMNMGLLFEDNFILNNNFHNQFDYNSNITYTKNDLNIFSQEDDINSFPFNL